MYRQIGVDWTTDEKITNKILNLEVEGKRRGKLWESWKNGVKIRMMEVRLTEYDAIINDLWRYKITVRW